jgi:hypothetical protein
MKHNNCPLSQTELRDLVAEAQDHLLQAVSALNLYIAFTGDHHTERTIVAAIECIASRDHQWLGRDHNLDDVLESLDEESEEEQDEDEEEQNEEEQELIMTRRCVGQPALTWRDANPFC